jgi:glycosyltransferase involved in cell wall biosynthesis
MKVKITVLMSVYNGERYINEAINSILGQTLKKFEFLIINDGSTDRTSEILQKYDDPRIAVIDNKGNISLTKSLNKGLQIAQGEYIARQDADDISLPRRLEIQAEFLDKNPDCALVGCAYYKMDENGELCSLVEVLSKDSDIREGLKKQNWFGHGCIMMRKDAVQAVGGYDEKYKFAQDYDLWLKIAEVYKVANIEEPLYCWRSTPSGISKDKEAEQKYYANLAVSEATKRDEQRMLQRNTGSSVMVSVIVPTYNRPDMLIETLKSILNQTYHDFEVIVVNDAGIDVESKIKLLNKNHNIKYLTHTENRGLAAARNTGIKAARGKYIAYLDDDDIFYADHLETLVNFLENSKYKVAYTDAYRIIQEKQNSNYVVKKKDIPFSLDFDYDRILVENFVPILCLMHERSCLEEIGLFDEKLTVCEDWDFLIRISRGFEIAHLKNVTSEYSWRTDGTNMISNRSTDFGRTFKIIYEKHREYSQNNPSLLLAQINVIASFIGTLEGKIIEKEQQIKSIYSSRTWKVGKIITASWRTLKRFLHLNFFSKST